MFEIVTVLFGYLVNKLSPSLSICPSVDNSFREKESASVQLTTWLY